MKAPAKPAAESAPKPKSPPAEERPIFTVGQVTRQIRALLSGLGRIQVEGEVSQVRVPASGHVYFSLKESDAVLACAIWRSRVERAMRFRLEEGMRVIVHGTLDVYAPRGTYSFIVDRVEQRGIGALLAQLEELKAELRDKGWMDRKRPLPALPRTVGVVTSRDGAAFQDFLRTRSMRWPLYPVRLAHAPVQGPGSAREIAGAIRALDESGVDVIVVCRGGGSLEDLWAFNERPVAEAIFESSTPVVSGVGHETDYTLADMVADHRAHTPTDAASVVIPERAALEGELERLTGYLSEAMERRLEGLEERLARAASSRVLSSPGWILDDRANALARAGKALQRSVDHALDSRSSEASKLAVRLRAQSPTVQVERLMARLERGARELHHRARAIIDGHQTRLDLAQRSLEAISPLAVLERGYSITLKDGKAVTSSKDVAPGDRLETHLSDGRVLSIADEVAPQDRDGEAEE